ncbi:divergent protein kinase domain 1C-like isoform X4 [Paramacrobiotus metropolitanus]|nr:divergent protein kinase domain 1C-like isoform X4 [Paramacrobiotus metropolitanus]
MLPAVYKRSVATSCEPVEGVPIYRQMRDYLLANYADFIPENFFSGLQNLDYSELLRLWEFIHQDEFLLLKILPYLKTINLYFPGLLGTCSDGFVVEKIPEIIDENFILEKSWEETVSVVYGFLQLVHQLDTASVELCDVQLGNFGWDPVVGRVKVIDLDLVFFRNLLAEQLAGRKCSVDGDCAMFDCQGKCDIQSGICTNQIENNNLARVCRDIFRPAFWRKGLFTGAPLLSKPGLNELAHRCSAKMTDSEDFLQKFSELIGKSL